MPAGNGTAMRQPDVVVVGGGPAGIGAALAAAESGSNVVLVDEHARPAGQYFKGTDGPGKDSQRIQFMRSELARLGVDVLTDALVWGIFDRDVMVFHDGRSEVMTPNAVVMATGAYDRPVPFPGWTLPGVMTAGAFCSPAPAPSCARSPAGWPRPGPRW